MRKADKDRTKDKANEFLYELAGIVTYTMVLIAFRLSCVFITETLIPWLSATFLAQ